MMMFITLLITLIPMFIILIFIPYWTRKTESFGVSIPEDLFYTDDLKAMRKKYAIQMTGLSLLFIIIFIGSFFVTSDETMMGMIFGGITLAYIVAGFFIYLVFHREMKQKKNVENWSEKKSERIVIHTKFRDQKLTVSNWLYIVPFLISIVTIGLTLIFYEKIPNQIAMHYSMSGEVTRWADKSYGTALFLPLTQLSLVVLFLVINIVIAKAKQQVSAQNPDESMQRNVVFRRRWSMFMWITALLLTCMFTFLHLGEMFFDVNETLMTVVPIAITMLIIGGTIILAITTGQGGSRIVLQSKKDEIVIDRDDDKHWKLGQFYVNKDDPTIFIEKRFGIGWTINFGQPLAWLTLIGIIVVPILIPIVISLL